MLLVLHDAQRLQGTSCMPSQADLPGPLKHEWSTQSTVWLDSLDSFQGLFGISVIAWLCIW